MLKTILAFLVFPFILVCQSGSFSDSLLSLWKKSSGEKAEQVEEILIMKMYTMPYDSATALRDKLFRVSPGLNNNSLYIKTLIHSYHFYNFNDKILRLNMAQFLAVKEKNEYLLSAAYMFKAIAFRDNSMTDSAMIYALKAKDVLEGLAPRYDLNSVLQLIADLHYYAGQYDEAEKTYRRILSEKSEDPNSWRYITINNNLGLIRIKQNRFAEALGIFKSSLNELHKRQMTYTDSSGLAYLYRKLLEVSVAMKNFEDANKYFITGERLTKIVKQDSELPGYYAAKGALCYDQGRYDSALYFYKLAESLDSKDPDVSRQVGIFDGLAHTYRSVKDYQRASDYFLYLLDAKNRSDSAFYRARYMNIYAEYNYKNYLREIEHYQARQYWLIIIISVITFSLIAIGYFFIKINKANRKLVLKNLELVEGYRRDQLQNNYKNEPDEAGENDKKEIAEKEEISAGSDRPNIEIDEEAEARIIPAFEQLMKAEKFYLVPEASLNRAAEKLNTNRTYLSRAINRAYGVHFNTYINDLRIKEAIHLISSGEAQHLNMEGLAAKSGFGNRVSFTKAFQKFTGVSPSFFIKNAEKY